MKKNIVITCLLFIAAISQAQDTIQKKIRVAVLLYPGVELVDFSGPTDVFIKANEMTRGKYEVYSVAFKPGAVHTQGGGPLIVPTYAINRMPKPDILVIPGSSMGVIDSLKKTRQMIAFLKKYQDSVSVTMSVCTGAYLLGGAGLLDHHRATTHYFVADDLAAQYPTITMVKDVRFVDEGKIVTTSGVSSGIDGALHLVKRYSGDLIAELVSRGLQYYPHDDEKWPVAFKGMKFDRNNPMNKATANEPMGMQDPVCHMTADKSVSTVYKGKTYHFCSNTCKKIFLQTPTDYIN